MRDYNTVLFPLLRAFIDTMDSSGFSPEDTAAILRQYADELDPPDTLSRTFQHADRVQNLAD